MKYLRRIILLTTFLLPLFLCAQQDSLPVNGNYFTAQDSTRIYYEEQGSGSPVILVHGFMGNGTSWKRTVLFDTLIKAGYRVIILDQRGNGRSDKPHTGEAYANDAEAKDIMQLATLLHLSYYDVVGYSRGSIITARLLVLDKRVQYAKKNGLDINALACQQKEQPSTSAAELAMVKIPVAVICGDKDDVNGNGDKLAAMIRGAQFISVPGEHNTAWITKDFAEKIIGFLKE